MDCTLRQMASDWDAERYHRVSDPQLAWGLKVLDRLRPVAGERILDIGCGTGRLTAVIVARAPQAQVIGMDRSAAMVSEAMRRSTAPLVVQADALRLPFTSSFDAVFSTATFHWVHDHARLFAEIYRALVPGGRLVAQAGGGPNLARLYGRSAALSRDPRFSPYFAGWENPWYFASSEEAADGLRQAGFVEIDAWLEQAPTSFDAAEHFREFIVPVCLRHQLDRLPDGSRDAFVRELVDDAAADAPPFTLDYWRLNLDARKP